MASSNSLALDCAVGSVATFAPVYFLALGVVVGAEALTYEPVCAASVMLDAAMVLFDAVRVLFDVVRVLFNAVRVQLNTEIVLLDAASVALHAAGCL